MVVKLQNSITFENRIRKLMNEPEKVTYGYINTKTQKLDLITFQNFQIFKWRNKNNKFIYTIRTSTRRDRIEQVTIKNFNQNTYLNKVDRENTFLATTSRKSL